MKLYFEYLEQLNEADEKIAQKEETLQEEISVGLEDSLRKYVKKFLKANARELEKELDRKGFVKLGDDLVREFSLMVDDYLEAAENYGKEDIEEVEFIEEEN